MTQATVFKSAGTCTDTSLPILYRDPAVSASTLFCYDLLDTQTWPSGAAPSGAATLVDLSPAAANASVGSTALGWSGGFVFDSGDADLITLPASSKLGSEATSFAFSIWIKNTSIAAGDRGIAGLCDGASYGSVQWSLHRSGATMNYSTDGSYRGAVALTQNAVTNWVITMTLSGSTYTHKLYKNGVVVLSHTSSSPMTVPAGVGAVIGALPTLFGANGDDFVFYRCHADSLASRTADQFVAADYAAGLGRFA